MTARFISAHSLRLGMLAGAAITLAAGAASASPLVSQDFDAGTFPASGIQDFEAGAFSASGIEDMQVAEIGAGGGACAHFSAGGSRAGGSALCGSGTASGPEDAFDKFVFTDPGLANALRIDVSLAAFEFGLLDGPADPANLFDFVKIFLGGEQIVQFHGVNMRTSPHDGLKLADAPSRFLGPDLVPADAEDPDAGRFFDFSFYSPAAVGDVPRDLTFQVRLTGTTEFAALDSISVTAIPVPGAMGLLAIGLAGVGLALRRRPAGAAC